MCIVIHTCCRNAIVTPYSRTVHSYPYVTAQARKSNNSSARPRWEAAARRQDTCHTLPFLLDQPADSFRGSKRSRRRHHRRSPSLLSRCLLLLLVLLERRCAEDGRRARHAVVAMVITFSTTCGCQYVAGVAFLLYLSTSHYYN